MPLTVAADDEQGLWTLLLPFGVLLGVAGFFYFWSFARRWWHAPVVAALERVEKAVRERDGPPTS